MNVFKQVLNFYINSSIHVALAVFSLSWITLMEFGLPYDENVLYFIFYATISGYNFVKFFGIAKFHHRRLAKWLKLIQVLSLGCFFLMCYYALHLEEIAWFYIFGFAVCTLLYAIPLLPKRIFSIGDYNLRSVKGLKVYVIALVWCGVTVFLPLINNRYNIDLDVILTALQRFIYVIVLMLPFEIRDLKYDSLELGTIPQKIGVKRTKFLGVILLGVFLSLEFFKNVSSEIQLIILSILMGVTLLMLLFSEEDRGQYYSSFWVEGLPILWLVLTLVFN